jgi:hypothetical protein
MAVAKPMVAANPVLRFMKRGRARVQSTQPVAADSAEDDHSGAKRLCEGKLKAYRQVELSGDKRRHRGNRQDRESGIRRPACAVICYGH